MSMTQPNAMATGKRNRYMRLPWGALSSFNQPTTPPPETSAYWLETIPHSVPLHYSWILNNIGRYIRVLNALKGKSLVTPQAGQMRWTLAESITQQKGVHVWSACASCTLSIQGRLKQRPTHSLVTNFPLRRPWCAIRHPRFSTWRRNAIRCVT
jgi:hypothetical protein